MPLVSTHRMLYIAEHLDQASLWQSNANSSFAFKLPIEQLLHHTSCCVSCYVQGTVPSMQQFWQSEMLARVSGPGRRAGFWSVLKQASLVFRARDNRCTIEAHRSDGIQAAFLHVNGAAASGRVNSEEREAGPADAQRPIT
jgi:hypothetical protein